MGDNKTLHNNNDTDMPKDEEKVLHNNNIFGRGRAGVVYRGRGYNRGIGHFAQNRGRFQIMDRGRGQGYRDRGHAAHSRGRYGYSNNWRRGRGYGWYAGHNSQFYKPRMINTGPWSAASGYRDRQHLRFHSQCSTPPIQTKIFMNPSTEFNPQIPPPSYYNSYPQGYLEPSSGCSYYHPQTGESHPQTEASPGCSYYHPQTGASRPQAEASTGCSNYHPQTGESHPQTEASSGCSNYYPQTGASHPQTEASTGCIYYQPQAGASHPQAFVSDPASGLVVVNNRGQMYNYQDGSFVELEDSSVSEVAQDSSILQVVAQMPRPEVLETAMAGLGLASSGWMQSSSSWRIQSSCSGGSNFNGEKSSNNNLVEEISGDKDENTNSLEPENKPAQEASGGTVHLAAPEASGGTGCAVHLVAPEASGGTGCAVHLAAPEASGGTGSAVHLATVANPLSLLGQSVEQDKHLVRTFSGVEMRPVSPFPPNYRLQHFFVPYGSPPPQHVIPVMVFPVLLVGHNPEANEVTEVRETDVENGQVKQNGESTLENEFPPARSLLPSYMGSMDLPCSPLMEPAYQPEPSPVEIYQPFTNPWPHQFMMDPLAPNVSLQNHQSHENRQ